MSTTPIDTYARPSHPISTAFMVAVMQAQMAGKRVMYGSAGTSQAFSTTQGPLWDWSRTDYWIDPSEKPAPKMVKVPLRPEDIGPVCWIRGKTSQDYRHLVSEVHSDGVYVTSSVGTYYHWHFKHMMDQAEYSTDLKTWHGCYREVAEGSS